MIDSSIIDHIQNKDFVKIKDTVYNELQDKIKNHDFVKKYNNYMDTVNIKMQKLKDFVKED